MYVILFLLNKHNSISIWTYTVIDLFPSYGNNYEEIRSTITAGL